MITTEILSNLLGCFEDGEFMGKRILVLGPSTPEWVWDMVEAAHGDMAPDNWKYWIIWNVLMAMRDHPSSLPVTEQELGSYVGKVTDWVTDRLSITEWLVDWLASSQLRWGYYAERALRELSGLGSNGLRLHDILTTGFREEVAEVTEVVVRAIWAKARDQTDVGALGGEVIRELRELRNDEACCDLEPPRSLQGELARKEVA